MIGAGRLAGLQPRFPVTAREREQPEAGPIALLGILFGDQPVIDDGARGLRRAPRGVLRKAVGA